MKNFTITKEQILEIDYYFGLSKNNNLKQWFPDAFNLELKVGEWYWRNEDELAVYNGGETTYGFLNYIFLDGMSFSAGITRKATDKEVEEALIKEAIRRGYVNGNYNCLSLPNHTHKVENNYHMFDNYLFHGIENKTCNVVFKDGKWAEIIETITKEEAEKQLNKRII